MAHIKRIDEMVEKTETTRPINEGFNNFKMTEEMKDALLKQGYKEEDFDSIKFAVQTGKMKFFKGDNNTKIKWDEALEILGIEKFVSGIARATFHASASRENGSEEVHFEFKWWK